MVSVILIKSPILTAPSVVSGIPFRSGSPSPRNASSQSRKIAWAAAFARSGAWWPIPSPRI